MDAPKAALRLSVLGVAAVLVALVALPTLQEGGAARAAVTQRDGASFVLPRSPGVYDAQWLDEPVLVVVTTQARLDGVDAARGRGEASPAVPLGDGLAVFVTSAVSNRLGCTGSVLLDLGASKDIADYDGDGAPDGRFVDRCHHGQWDIYHRGAPVPGTPTQGALAQLRIEVKGDGLVGSGFSGPVGAQGR